MFVGESRERSQWESIDRKLLQHIGTLSSSGKYLRSNGAEEEKRKNHGEFELRRRRRWPPNRIHPLSPTSTQSNTSERNKMGKCEKCARAKCDGWRQQGGEEMGKGSILFLRSDSAQREKSVLCAREFSERFFLCMRFANTHASSLALGLGEEKYRWFIELHKIESFSEARKKGKYFQFFVFFSEHVCRCVVCFGRRSIERKFMSRRCRFHSNESRSFIIAAFRLMFFFCGASSLFVWYVLSLCCWRVPLISWIEFFMIFLPRFFSMPLDFFCESENYQRILCVIARVGSLRRNSRHNSNYRTKND